MFEKIDTVLTAVDAVSGIEYVSDIIADEITAYSAFVIDGDVELELEKISVNGQIYNATMRTEFYLHVKYDSYSKAQFKTLFENVIKAIAALTDFQYIKATDLKTLMPFQIGQEKTRTMFGTIEFLTKETWV